MQDIYVKILHFNLLDLVRIRNQSISYAHRYFINNFSIFIFKKYKIVANKNIILSWYIVLRVKFLLFFKKKKWIHPIDDFFFADFRALCDAALHFYAVKNQASIFQLKFLIYRTHVLGFFFHFNVLYFRSNISCAVYKSHGNISNTYCMISAEF